MTCNVNCMAYKQRAESVEATLTQTREREERFLQKREELLGKIESKNEEIERLKDQVRELEQKQFKNQPPAHQTKGPARKRS